MADLAADAFSAFVQGQLARENLARLRSRAQKDSADILQLGTIFVELRNLQNNIQMSRDIFPPHDTTQGKPLQHELDRQADLVSDLSQDLACAIFEHPEASPAGLRVKALVLMDYVEENSDDIVHCMARALCASLLVEQHA
eukprot:gene14660-14782_t